MLTYGFILTLLFADLGGGGTVQTHLKTETVALCTALRRAIMTQLPDMNGHAGACIRLAVPERRLPEVD